MLVFKVRNSDSMPRKNSYWTACYFTDEMGSYKNWGELSWAELREDYQRRYSDAYCAWVSKSDNPDFCLVGIKGITLDFASLLEEDKPIIAFGPKDPTMVMEIPRQTFFVDGEFDSERVFVGASLPMQTQDGYRISGIVESINDDVVVMDFNHQLAGERVHYVGEVVAVRDATPEELNPAPHGCGCGCGHDHGHDHGCDCGSCDCGGCN
jgi:hypothetical protein